MDISQPVFLFSPPAEEAAGELFLCFKVSHWNIIDPPSRYNSLFSVESLNLTLSIAPAVRNHVRM